MAGIRSGCMQFRSYPTIGIRLKGFRQLTAEIRPRLFGSDGIRLGVIDLGAQEIHIVAINDPSIGIDEMVDKFGNGSVHGKFDGEVSHQDGKLIVNGQQVAVFNEKEPSKILWNQLGAEYVVESTDLFTTIEKCQPHIEAGAKKVIIATSSTDAPIFVFGVNQNKYTRKETMLSNASCTINCLAPLAKFVHEKFGIDRGSLIAQTSFELGRDTADERSNQNSSSECGSAQDINVSSSDVAEAIGKIIPDLNGKLTCTIDHVPPTPNVLFVILTVQLEKKATYKEICAAIKEAANGLLNGILAYTDDEIVPTDLIVNTHLSIFDAKAGNSLNDNLVKLVSWCKNECGYSYQLINLIKYIDFIKYCPQNQSTKKLGPSNN